MLDADSIHLEKFEAVGHGPDAHGDLRIECAVTVAHDSAIRDPLARLRVVVVDESCEWPLAAGESALSQRSDADSPGQLTVRTSLHMPDLSGGDVSELGVRPTLLIYPVPWARVARTALPPVGNRRCDTPVRQGDLQVDRWWVVARASSGILTEYEIGVCLQNRGPETLALGVLAIALEDESNRPLWSELCSAEGIGPGEERVLTSRISVAGDRQVRGANRITLSAGAVRAPVVVPLAVWQIEMSAGPAGSLSGHRTGAARAGVH